MRKAFEEPLTRSRVEAGVKLIRRRSRRALDDAKALARENARRVHRRALRVVKGVPARSRPQPIRLKSPQDVARLLTLEESYVLPLNLVVADYSVLRALTLPRRGDPCTSELKLRVTPWDPPHGEWRGAPKAIRGLVEYEIRSSVEKRWLELSVTLSTPQKLAEIVAAVMPVVRPVVELAGSQMPEIAVDITAPVGALAVIPTTVASGVRPRPKQLRGVGLPRADVLIAGADYDAARTLGDHPPSGTTVVMLDDSGEPLTVRERQPSRALIDLRSHNPIGRIPIFKALPFAWRADLRGDVLIARDAAGREELGIALDRPIGQRQTRVLRRITGINCSGVNPPRAPGDMRLLLTRLAEIAATGAIVHSLPQGREWLEGDFIAADLLADFQQPYEDAPGLHRDARSAQQRRMAMHGHAGVLRLASHLVEEHGLRILPTVSVIVSSMRPARVSAVLNMIARQTYPYLEAIAVIHGAPTPDFSAEPALGDLDLRLIEVGAEKPFGAALAAGLRASTGDLVVKMDDDDWYGAELIWDLVLAHLYSGADVVGKTTEYLYFEGIDQTVHRTFATERYHEQVAGGTMMLTRSAIEGIGGWRATPNSTDRSILIRVEAAGGLAYRTHSLGYAYIRHGDGHTWHRADSMLMSGVFEQWKGFHRPATSWDLEPAAGRVGPLYRVRAS